MLQDNGGGWHTIVGGLREKHQKVYFCAVYPIVFQKSLCLLYANCHCLLLVETGHQYREFYMSSSFPATVKVMIETETERAQPLGGDWQDRMIRVDVAPGQRVSVPT